MSKTFHRNNRVSTNKEREAAERAFNRARAQNLRKRLARLANSDPDPVMDCDRIRELEAISAELRCLN